MLYICIEEGKLVAGAQVMPDNIAALGEEGWRARGWLPCVDVDQRVEGEDYADPAYEWDEREGRRILRTIPQPE
jgi:hypothetical protein